MLTTIAVALVAFQPRGPCFQPQRILSSRHLQCRASEASVTLTQPSKERASQLDVLTWNYVAAGEGAYDGKSAFGDGIATVSPSSPDVINERLPGGSSLRYVFDGAGTLTAGGKSYKLKRNTLVEVVAEPAGVEVVWTRGSTKHLVVASSEYDSPARRIVRGALPFLGAVFAIFVVVSLVSGALVE